MIKNWNTVPLYRVLNPELAYSYNFFDSFDTGNDYILDCDCDRTRPDQLNNSDRVVLKNMIKYFCKEYKIKYKQGINEVIAPFIMLCDKGLNYGCAYECFKSFLKACLPNLFHDEVFYS
jgi:Rab-GTPase-TBC domain